MRINHFDSMILGPYTNGQGSVNAVEGTHRTALRMLVAKTARRLSLRLGSWRAQARKRAAAATTPAVAMCPIDSATRRQRDQRWMPVVVVDTGTVGVC
jgi:hypothetical protein